MHANAELQLEYFDGEPGLSVGTGSRKRNVLGLEEAEDHLR